MPWIAIENPVGCISTRISDAYARDKGFTGQKATQYIQPHEYGHDASKKTGLWLKGLPKLTPTKHVPPRIVSGKKRWANQTDSGQNKLGPSKDRAAIRAKTYQGIADAMAEQWGLYCTQYIYKDIRLRKRRRAAQKKNLKTEINKMSTKKTPREQAAKKELEAMNLLMTDLSAWGAADSEPRYMLDLVMAEALRGNPFPVNRVECWELYSTRPGWKSAASKLTKQAKKVYSAIQDMPLRAARATADWYGITF
jgi:hypothetical protein